MAKGTERVGDSAHVRGSKLGRGARFFADWQTGVLLRWSDVDKAMFLVSIPLPMLVAGFIRLSFVLADPNDEPYLSRPVVGYTRWAVGFYVAYLAALLPAWQRVRRTSPASPAFIRAALFLFCITGSIAAYVTGHFSTPIMGAIVAAVIAVQLLFETRVARPVILFGALTLFGPVPFIASHTIPYAPLYASSPFIGAEPPANWLYMSLFFSVVIIVVPASILSTLLERWRKHDAEIHKLAKLDGLTEIPNRRYFLERLDAELARAGRYDASAALLLLDLDHFKRINDGYGHQVGDRALCHVAELLTSDVVRRIDVVGRYGGEEFAVLLPETDLDGAVVVAERIRAALASSPLLDGDVPIAISASIGVAAFPGPGVTDLDALVRRADDALYRAKHEGRNRVATDPLENRTSHPSIPAPELPKVDTGT